MTNAHTDHTSFASDLREIENQYTVPLSPPSPFGKVPHLPTQTCSLPQ